MCVLYGLDRNGKTNAKMNQVSQHRSLDGTVQLSRTILKACNQKKLEYLSETSSFLAPQQLYSGRQSSDFYLRAVLGSALVRLSALPTIAGAA